MKYKILSLILLFLSTVSVATAQSVVVEAKMDSSVMLMGHQTNIHLSLIQDAGENVAVPQIKERDVLVEGVEALRFSDPDTLFLSNNRIQIDHDVLVTSFDSGFYYIPPFEYILNNDTFKTESLSLKIIPVNVDSAINARAIIDIKNIIDVPFSLWDLLPLWAWITIPVVILLIVVIVILVIYLLKRRKQSSELPQVPAIPPYDLAVQQLQQLRDEKLWQQGQDRIYYTRLTDILRVYLAGRFGINAMEMPTSDIWAELKKLRQWREANKLVKEVLELADFVKFAKMSPSPEENERVMRHACEYVELTREQPQPPAEEEGKPTTGENKQTPADNNA